MIHPGPDRRTRLTRLVRDLLIHKRRRLAHLQHASRHRERRARMRLLHEPDVLVARPQRRLRIGPERMPQPHNVSQLRQPLHHLRDVEAHIHVPHLIAFPGVDAAAIEFDHAVPTSHSPFTVAQVGFADQAFSFELVPRAMMKDNPDGLDLAAPSICFHVDDLDAELARLEGLGYRRISGPKPGADGMRIAFLHPSDTSKVLVEVVEG